MERGRQSRLVSRRGQLGDLLLDLGNDLTTDMPLTLFGSSIGSKF